MRKGGGAGCSEIEGVSSRRGQRPQGGLVLLRQRDRGLAGRRERKLFPGDKVWWDHHDAQTAASVPAVVGAFPEPFASGSEGTKLPIRLVCMGGGQRECDEVESGCRTRA